MVFVHMLFWRLNARPSSSYFFSKVAQHNVVGGEGISGGGIEVKYIRILAIHSLDTIRPWD